MKEAEERDERQERKGKESFEISFNDRLRCVVVRDDAGSLGAQPDPVNAAEGGIEALRRLPVRKRLAHGARIDRRLAV